MSAFKYAEKKVSLNYFATNLTYQPTGTVRHKSEYIPHIYT